MTGIPRRSSQVMRKTRRSAARKGIRTAVAAAAGASCQLLCEGGQPLHACHVSAICGRKQCDSDLAL